MGLVRALRERLVHQLGVERVFFDVETIDAGADFRSVLRDAVRRCEVLLVVIGRHWLVSEDGRRRLEEPEDVVHLEIATALEAGVRIVPVLVDGAHIPAAADLPEPVRELAGRNAVEITNARFDADADRLLRALVPPRPFPTWAAALVIAGIVALGLYSVRAAGWAGFLWGLIPLAALPALGLVPLLRRRLPATGPSRSLAAGLCLVAFALFLTGGLAVRAQQAATPFDLDVHVIEPGAPPDGSTAGDVVLAFDGESLRAPIGPGAVARFRRVPGSARGRDALVFAIVDGYRQDTLEARVSDDARITVRLVEQQVATIVRGRVIDRGNRPLAGVRLDFGEGIVSTTSGEDGQFTVTVPWKPGESVLLRATRLGVVGYEQRVTIPSSLSLDVPFTGDGG